MTLSNKNFRATALLAAFVCVLLLSSCAMQSVTDAPKVDREKGKASWYGPGFYGRRTASGEKFTSKDMTAAHKTLPFGTHVKVVNLDNNRSAIVRINDRGPFSRGRIIDVSKAAAKELGLIATGTADVVIFYLPKADKEIIKEAKRSGT